MDTTLDTLIQNGDMNALNAYLSQQDVTGNVNGISVNGQPSNALTALFRGQSIPSDSKLRAQPVAYNNPPITNDTLRNQPMPRNYIQADNGQYLTPAGERSNMPVDIAQSWTPTQALTRSGQMRPALTDGKGNISIVTDSGDQIQTTVAEQQALKQQVQRDQMLANMPQNMTIAKYQKILAEIGKDLAQTASSSDIKPRYEPSNNSFIIPPDAQHPNGQVIPAGGAGGGQQQAALTGTDFLQTLAKPQADQVKALAEGRMAFPAGFALKSPYWQDMISKVSQYDPTFDAVNYQARQQTRNDFTKGASANNVTALNTAIQHLGKLSDAYDQLNNSSYPMWNTAANYLGNTFGNQDVQKNYAAVSTDATAVAHELAKVFRQSGMSEAEIKDWSDKISTSASPAQSRQVIQSAMDLMQGRLESLGARYNQGMGTTKQPYQLMTPEAQQTWARLNNRQQAPQQAQASNPLAVTAPDGSRHVFPNAAAADAFRKAIGM